MNDRIRELYQQAHSIRYHDGDPMRDGDPPTVYWQGEKSAEKFAELIVKECDHLIQQQVSLKYKDGWEQSGLSDDWAYGHYAASTLSRTIIKQHFGVGE